MAATTLEQTKRCDTSKIKVGSTFSRHSFGTVTKFGGNSIYLKNTEGYEWSITADIVEQEFCFADQYDEEEKASRTAVIEVITDNPATAMTICFNKKPDPKAVAKLLKEGQGEDSARAWNKKVKLAIGGAECTLVGYHTGSFDEHRRLRFHKMNADGGTDFRLVDPRTINWIICARKKYIVK